MLQHGVKVVVQINQTVKCSATHTIEQREINNTKDDFQKEVAFFYIIGSTISCSWCKLVYNSL